jgi:alkylation response protein AidB-like acyl-CoA dehydrogenase
MMGSARFSFLPAAFPEGCDALRAEVRAFLNAEGKRGGFTPHSSGWMVFDRAFSLKCGKAGFIGVTWPKAYGGAERSFLERFVIIEEMLAAGAPLGAHWVGDRQSGPQILRHGTAELKTSVLPAMARGEVTFAIGMSEPDAGSDLAAIRSRAERVDGGWRLEGRKIWTTNGHRADYMIGLFRTMPRDDANRHAGLTQFVVDLRVPGVERRPIMDMTGEEDFAEMTFDGAFVPDSHVLGEPGQGWSLVLSELAYERSGPERFMSVFPVLAEVVSGLEHLDDSGCETLGRLVSQIATLREMSISIAGRLAQGEAPSLEAAVVKDLGNALECEMPGVIRVLPGATAIRGGGSTAELVARAILAAPSFTLRGGTPEVLRGIIARGLGLR